MKQQMTRYIGYVKSVSNDVSLTNCDTKNPAGTLTAKQLLVSYGNIQYSFTLSDAITIKNDY